LEIESGIIEGEKQEITTKILDRKEAIREVLLSAHPGDVVIITGKGSEPWLMVKRKRISWDDREIVREELNTILDKKREK
jgi:UDP-N-acetylmuramoyl-L-alanyl-D-glutamate--2,6-diaminopimelate ligase